MECNERYEKVSSPFDRLISAILNVPLVESYFRKKVIGSVKSVTTCAFVNTKNVKNIFEGIYHNVIFI